jgi:iron-sulfur cluster repair protein YtfE (RIC family)
MDYDPTLTVAQMVHSHPPALAVLTAAGIDTCCDGGLSLAGAAARAGLRPSELMARLREGITRHPKARGPNRCACDCGTT